MSRVSKGVEPRGTVEIHFSPARTIDAWRPDGSRVSLPSVTQAHGEAIRGHPDSVTLRIKRWEGGSPFGQRPDAKGAQATFSSSDPEISYYQRRISVMKSTLLAGTIVGLIALAIGQADIATPGTIGYPLLPFAR